MEYDLDIVHHAGFRQPEADALLRRSTEETKRSYIKAYSLVMAVSRSEQKRFSDVNESTPKQTYIKTKEPELPTLYVFMSAQNSNAYWDNNRPTVKIPRSSFIFNKKGLLVRHSPICGSVHQVVPPSMCPIIWRLADHFSLAGYPGEPQMYDTLKPEYYRPNMSTEVYNTVRNY